MFKSKKFVVALTGMIVVFLTNYVGMTPEQAETITKAITIIASAFVAAQGVADAARDFNPKP